MPLPLKKLLTESDVDDNREMFEAVQGYSLVSHGRDHVWLALLSFPERQTPTQKKELARILCSYAEQASSAYELYTSYRKHQEDKAKGTAANYQAKPCDTSLAAKPPVFAVGLAAPAYGLYPTGKPNSKEFDEGFIERFKQMPEVKDLAGSDRYAAVIVLASNNIDDLCEYKKRLKKELQGLAAVTWEKGKVNKVTLPGTNKKVVEDYFGFKEGISQPVFFKIETHRTSDWESGWDPAVGLGCVLTQQPDAQNNNEYGSFMVFLKIEQKVDDFEKVVNAAAGLIAKAKVSSSVLAGPASTPEVVAAARAKALTESTDLVMGHLMGRKPDGEPLVEPGSTDSNDFDFANDPNFSRCPVNAHIRKVNPRTEHNRNKRILRRGVLYDDKDGKRGILFQCFQSELLTGFEHLFGEWAMNENFPKVGAGKDAILGSSTSAAKLATTAVAQDSFLQMKIQNMIADAAAKEEAELAKKKTVVATAKQAGSNVGCSETTPGNVSSVAVNEEAPLQYDELKHFTKIKAGEYFYFRANHFSSG